MNSKSRVGAKIALRWVPSLTASSIHAAAAMSQGQLLVDDKIANAVDGPSQQLRQLINSSGLPKQRLWRNLAGLAISAEGSMHLAERALMKTAGAQGRHQYLAQQLAAAIADLDAALRRAIPDLLEDLNIRGGPLRHQWEARGPGMMRLVAATTEPELIVSNADVVLVCPALGGGGAAHLPYNSVRLEAVLTDGIAELPEVVRLAWMLSQLNVDLPRFSDSIHADRLPHIAALAMLPPVLRAAEQVELVQFEPETVDLAIKHWHIITPPDLDVDEIVMRWWGTYEETRPRWEVALTALDRMVG